MKIHHFLSAVTVSLLLQACFNSSDSHNSSGTEENIGSTNEQQIALAYSAAIVTVDPSYMGGAVQIADIDYRNKKAKLSSEVLSFDQSDYTVSAFEDYFYHIGRFQIDGINKHAFSAPSHSLWSSVHPSGWNTAGTDYDANAYDIVFVNDQKAYMIRYGSTKAWIINPSAEKESNFKMGELDLSAYADADGVPEMAAAIIAKDKLFIVMQRLVDWCPIADAYIAVFDTKTDQEIDINSINDPENLKGIRLNVKNPSNIDYHADIGLMVSGVGAGTIFSCVPPNRYSGGIDVINPDTYESKLLIDDGDESYHPYDFISRAIVLDKDNGYFVSYADWQDTKLYHFTPHSGAINGIVNHFGNHTVDIRTLNKAPDNTAWVGIAQDVNNAKDSPRLFILNKDQDIVTQFKLNRDPEAIAFGKIVYSASYGESGELESNENNDNADNSSDSNGENNGDIDNSDYDDDINIDDESDDSDTNDNNDEDSNNPNSCAPSISVPVLSYPFAPAHNQAGTTALFHNDPRFVAWATGHENYMPGEEVLPVWQTPEKAYGHPGNSSNTKEIGNLKNTDSVYDVVVLGRGGEITMTFDKPIRNGEGPDFAVFENSFDHKFLELAWVEVSSDGINFYRFPNYSYTEDPVPGFGYVDASKIHNLAGKYQGQYGTPFDLDELQNQECLDINNITHIKLIDIVGNGQAEDSLGNIIYDPYPTVQSAGFDLDAIGVIHQADD